MMRMKQSAKLGATFALCRCWLKTASWQSGCSCNNDNGVNCSENGEAMCGSIYVFTCGAVILLWYIYSVFMIAIFIY